MKQSNQTHINPMTATKDVNEYPNTKLPVTGPTSAPQEQLLAGKLVSFKNAERADAPNMKSYNFEE